MKKLPLSQFIKAIKKWNIDKSKSIMIGDQKTDMIASKKAGLKFIRKRYNLMREVRRVCHARVHSLTNFQRITFNSFTEDNSEQVNVWVGTVDIELQNNAVLLEIT